MKNTVNPQWNEVHVIPISDFSIVTFQVWDDDQDGSGQEGVDTKQEDDPLGYISVSVDALTKYTKKDGEPIRVALELEDADSGVLELEMRVEGNLQFAPVPQLGLGAEELGVKICADTKNFMLGVPEEPDYEPDTPAPAFEENPDRKPFTDWLSDYAEDNPEHEFCKLNKLAVKAGRLFPKDGTLIDYMKFFRKTKAPKVAYDLIERAFAVYAPFKEWLISKVKNDPEADDVLKKFAKMVSSDSKFLPTGTYDEYIEALEKKKMKDGTRKAINVCLTRSFKLYSVRKHSAAGSAMILSKLLTKAKRAKKKVSVRRENKKIYEIKETPAEALESSIRKLELSGSVALHLDDMRRRRLLAVKMKLVGERRFSDLSEEQWIKWTNEFLRQEPNKEDKITNVRLRVAATSLGIELRINPLGKKFPKKISFEHFCNICLEKGAESTIVDDDDVYGRTLDDIDDAVAREFSGEDPLTVKSTLTKCRRCYFANDTDRSGFLRELDLIQSMQDLTKGLTFKRFQSICKDVADNQKDIDKTWRKLGLQSSRRIHYAITVRALLRWATSRSPVTKDTAKEDEFALRGRASSKNIESMKTYGDLCLDLSNNRNKECVFARQKLNDATMQKKVSITGHELLGNPLAFRTIAQDEEKALRQMILNVQRQYETQSTPSKEAALALQDSIFAADARVRAALQVGGEEDILYAILDTAEAKPPDDDETDNVTPDHTIEADEDLALFAHELSLSPRIRAFFEGVFSPLRSSLVSLSYVAKLAAGANRGDGSFDGFLQKAITVMRDMPYLGGCAGSVLSWGLKPITEDEDRANGKMLFSTFFSEFNMKAVASSIAKMITNFYRDDLISLNKTTLHDPGLDARLPDGWEMEVTPQGKRYFIDHNTMKTTTRNPRLDGKNHRLEALAMSSESEESVVAELASKVVAAAHTALEKGIVAKTEKGFTNQLFAAMTREGDLGANNRLIQVFVLGKQTGLKKGLPFFSFAKTDVSLRHTLDAVPFDAYTRRGYLPDVRQNHNFLSFSFPSCFFAFFASLFNSSQIYSARVGSNYLY